MNKFCLVEVAIFIHFVISTTISFVDFPKNQYVAIASNVQFSPAYILKCTPFITISISNWCRQSL